MANCLLCNNETDVLLDLGMQPVCSRFLKSTMDKEQKHSLMMGLCESCGLVQLINPFPVEEIKPAYDWINYSEPEEHLDELAVILSGLLKDKTAKICGISFKDGSLIERMRKLGFLSAVRLDIQKDLGSESNIAGVETVQDLLNVKRAKEIAEKNGGFDIVIARHILEHAYNPKKFLSSLRELVKPEGYIVLEVPDCAMHFENLDYSTIWEEHILYFTPLTFRNFLELNSFAIEEFKIFPYALENCMTAILNPLHNPSGGFTDNNSISKEVGMALPFFKEFQKRKKSLGSFFSECKKNNCNIAFFGAGHFASIFINIFGLKDYISCVIDDNKNKQGLFMPGSHLPILGSSALLDKNINLSIFSLNPQAEDKIISKNIEFTEKGGSFLSLCPASRRSLYSYMESHSNLVFREESREVYYNTENFVSIGKQDIGFFKKKAGYNERQKSRLCTHKDISDRLHEMFIVHRKGAYITPHKHMNKSESLHVIEGSAYLVIFDGVGNLSRVIELGEYSSGGDFYYRMSDSYYHTLFITSDYFVFHETTNGPLNRSETIFPSWAPEESSKDAVAQFMEDIEKQIENSIKNKHV